MNHWLRIFRRRLGANSLPFGAANPLELQRRAFERAQLLVGMFYAANLFFAGWRLAERARWDNYESLDPLWPLFWAAGGKVSVVAANVLTLNVIAAALAAFFPTIRWVRWTAFGGALLAGAFENSFGRVGHGGHAWVWIALFFAFLPTGSAIQFADSRLRRQQYLQTFWSTQFAVLFFYSMSGWLKLVTVPVQLLHGEVCSLAPEALARHVANRMLQTHSHAMFGNWAINYQWLSWPLFLGAVYLEAFSVLIAFRPALHRLWGSALVLLHVGIGLSMDIWFVPPMFLLTLIFLYSPFDFGQYDWRQRIAELPGIGWAIGQWGPKMIAGASPIVENSRRLIPK
jgi:hypothetical protein